MEIVISGLIILKTILYLFISVILLLICFFPTGEKKAGVFQWILFIVGEAVMFAYMYNFLTVRIVD